MTTLSTSPSDEPTSPGKESLPPHTSEIGTLKKLPDHDTEWLGSSSGVYFVNTVRRAFSAATSATTSGSQPFPASEDILAGGQDGSEVVDVGGNRRASLSRTSTSSSVEKTLAAALGKPPERSIASDLVMSYFKAWHPLFPFLHGPSFLHDMESLYPSEDQSPSKSAHTSSRSGPTRKSGHPEIDIRKEVVFQLIINVASLDRADKALPAKSRIRSSADVTRMAGVLAFRHDIASIQALVAAELYLVATMALREASTVGGMLLRNMFHAGLHRCPLRYAQLSPEDCEIRKRIFWSAYALDRHLSQSLGTPLTIQDSDIDTCLSGSRELHKPVTREAVVNPSKEILLHMPSKFNFPSALSPSSVGGTDEDFPLETVEEEEKQRREAALRSYVQYSRLTGRAVEAFHKSIHARFPERDTILYLTSDIESWWNDLPGYLSGEDAADVSAHQKLLIPFFTILYQNLLILVNRPALSLDPASADFQHGLQVCIKASRTTLSALKAHHSQGLTTFWPGLLAANWMAGLIIAFACLLGKHPVSRACTDITNCLELLNAIPSRRKNVKQCQLVLSALLKDIQHRKVSPNGFVSTMRSDVPAPDRTRNGQIAPEAARKRRRTEDAVRDGRDMEKTVLDQNLPTISRNATQPERATSTSLSIQGAPRHASFSSPSSSTNSAPLSTVPLQWPNDNNGATAAYHPQYTGSQYMDTQAFSYQAADSLLPELPLENSDSSQWNNFDFNMADVFESATWENLIGSTEPDVSAWGFQL